MRVVVVVIVLLIAAPAAAQSTSIGVTAAWDVVRFSRVETGARSLPVLTSDDGLDGEALGFSVSVRRGIGENWGVAAEYSRSGEIESVSRLDFSPLLTGGTTTIPSLPGGTRILPTFPNIPIRSLEFSLRTEQQHQTIAALVWARQELGDRIDLSYTGGITFVRSEYEREYSIDERVLALLIAPTELSSVDFNVGAAAGVDVDFEFTEHTALTAGVRLQSLGGAGRSGWLVRPAVGVRWTF